MHIWRIAGVCMLLVLTACQQSSSESPKDEPPTPVAVNPTFVHLKEHVPQKPNLPYTINEVDLKMIQHRNYLAVKADSVLDYLPQHNPDANYYLVAMPIDESHYTALLWLESELDTLFNARESFFLVSYDPEGKQVAHIRFAGSVSEDKTFRTTGTLYADKRIHTEKYEYEFRNGSWLKMAEPIKVVDYQIEANGMIREVDSEINVEPANDTARVSSLPQMGKAAS